jgi:hypothetical protein
MEEVQPSALKPAPATSASTNAGAVILRDAKYLTNVAILSEANDLAFVVILSKAKRLA